MNDGRTVVTLRLDKGLADQLKTFAKQRNSSLTSVLNEACRSLISPAPGPRRRPDVEEFEDFEDARIARSVSAEERNRIADWVALTQPVLGRFHLRLERVEDSGPDASSSFVGSRMEKRFILSVGVTALGTWLYGGKGAGRGKEKSSLNALKKQADAISAYILSEALFFSTRGLRENHALMVSLGEGSMPKAGETPEQGANPQIAFGRIFARPDVACALRKQVRLLLDGSRWGTFWGAIRQERLTVMGAVIDTLENTSRFTRGDPTGPMVALHIFDQPLTFTSPYESYMGVITVPQKVVERAEECSLAIHYRTPRADILAAILKTYPDVPVRNIHVWTLAGHVRTHRLSTLWNEWKDLGVHLVEDGWVLPLTGRPVFVDSGTYAPVYCAGVFRAGDESHLFLPDGYASSAEAIQAASLDPGRGQRTFLCPLTPDFREPLQRDCRIMQIKSSGDLAAVRQDLSEILERPISVNEAQMYDDMLRAADRANMPRGRRILTIDDFLPNKNWQCLAISAAILDDPYSDMDGIREEGNRAYRVCVRVVDSRGLHRKVTLTLGLDLPNGASQKAFSPLLDRLYEGEPYEARAIKSSDVGRILNELRTWSWNCVMDQDGTVLVNLDSVDEVVIPTEKRKFILRTLKKYKRDYSVLAKHVILEGQLAAEA